MSLEWRDQDDSFQFDSTVIFGDSMDWDMFECTAEMADTCLGSFIVWGDGYPNYKWSVYGGELCYLMFKDFDSCDDAKKWVQTYHEDCLKEIEK